MQGVILFATGNKLLEIISSSGAAVNILNRLGVHHAML